MGFEGRDFDFAFVFIIPLRCWCYNSSVPGKRNFWVGDGGLNRSQMFAYEPETGVPYCGLHAIFSARSEESAANSSSHFRLARHTKS